MLDSVLIWLSLIFTYYVFYVFYGHVNCFYGLKLIILYIIFSLSTTVLDTVLIWLCHFTVYYVISQTRLWYIVIQMYITTQREVQIWPLVRSHCYSKFSMALGCISPLFSNLKYISYIVKIGGGGYVVKTYPSIDPIVPPPNIYAYISVRLFNRVLWRNNVTTCLAYTVWRGPEWSGPPVNTCSWSVEKRIVPRAHGIKIVQQSWFLLNDRIMPPCQSSILLMYFMSSFCTYFLITFHLLPYLSLYICYFLFTSTHKFLKLLYIFVG